MMTTTSSNHSAFTLPSDGPDTGSAAHARRPLAYRTSWRDPVTYLPLAILAVFALAWVGSLLAEPRPAGDIAPTALSEPATVEPTGERSHVYWPSDAGESVPPTP